MATTIPYGLTMTASNAADIVKANYKDLSGENPWTKMLGSAGRSYQQDVGDVSRDYSDVIASAYQANLANRDITARSPLSAASADIMSRLSQQDLMNTYNTYKQNYQKNLATATENYANNVNTINTAYQTETDNLSKLYSALYDYAKSDLASATGVFLPDNPETDSSGNVIQPEAASWFKNQGLEWALDEEGNLLAQDALVNILYDENKALTNKGEQFFNALLNARTEGYTSIGDKGEYATRGFDKWLSETNPELRQWYASYNPYYAGKTGGDILREAVGANKDRTYIPQQARYADYNAISKGIDELKGSLDKAFEYKRAEDRLNPYEREVYRQNNMPGALGAINRWSNSMTGVNVESENSSWSAYLNKMGRMYSDLLTNVLSEADAVKLAETDAAKNYRKLLKSAEGKTDAQAQKLYAKQLKDAYAAYLDTVKKYIEDSQK